jgi:2,4-didehydro-3-deoxy-L-rhamnonate hydrolase
MKLMRIGTAGDQKAAVSVGGDSYVDLSDIVATYDGAFLATGGVDGLRGVVAERVALARPHQVLCIGLNYSDHAAETGQAVPDEPIVFNKAPNTVVGPNDTVLIPRTSTKTDWEVELGIVIGKRCRHLADQTEAAAHIAGYVLVNDVSERAFQMERGGQWVKDKSSETFNPAGLYLVTPDEIDDVLALSMWLDVNAVRRLTGSTSTMVFSPSFLVHYLSQFMVLEPGDLINTGTPPGVGLGMKPPMFLALGDVMELGIDGLDTQRQHLEAA